MKSNEAFDLFSVTEIELIYRNKGKVENRPLLDSSKAAYELLLNTWNQNKIDLVEQFKIMLLDRRNRCMGLSEISTGGMTACIVDPKIVFATALKARATGIIMAHNHPSGNKLPSESDKSLTKTFIQAGKMLELPVIDHIIVTRDGYTSFADEGLVP